MDYINQQFKRLNDVKRGLIILAIGVILGILFSKIFKNLYWNQIDLIDSTYLNKIKSTKLDYSLLFNYVLWKNFRTFAIFWIVCITPLGIPYISLSLLYCGFQSSFFVTVILMKFGIKGILLIFGYTFPHYLIYILVVFLCLRSGYWLSNSLYSGLKLNKRNKVEQIIKHLVFIIILAGVLLLGSVLETYIGSNILKKILILF